MDDKIIVSNRAALTTKYGGAGVTKIKASIADLIAADAKRGIKSRLVYLDDAAAMKRFSGRAVTEHTNARQNKEAIDAIFKAASPEYLMILGAPDVVPHQDMSNPMFDPPDDPDRYALRRSALRVRCTVLARHRDVQGADAVWSAGFPISPGPRSPRTLLAVLDVAAKYQPRPVTDYGAYFGLVDAVLAEVHRARACSTSSATPSALTLAPPNGPTHPAARLAPLAHFINCHGGQADPAFYGENGNVDARGRSPARPSRARSSPARWPLSNAATAPSCTTPSPWPCRCRSASTTWSRVPTAISAAAPSPTGRPRATAPPT